MSETNKFIRKLEGYALVDTGARERIEELSEENAAIKKDIETLKGEGSGEGSTIEFLKFNVNQSYNQNTGVFVQNNKKRVSMAAPVAFNSGETLVVNVADGERVVVQYLLKPGSSGVMNDDYTFHYDASRGWKTEKLTLEATENVYVFVTVARDDNDATEITSADISTTAYIEHLPSEEEGGDALPQYWQDHLKVKTADIDTAMNAIGNHGDAFVFFTDPHWSGNVRRTPGIARYIRKHTSIKNVFCGGDIATSAERSLRGYRNAWNDVPVFTARGNHDQNPASSDQTDIISDGEYYNLILRPIEDKAALNGQLYFHMDNEAQKIRYIFMDSGCSWISTLDDVQINWLKERLTELETGWSVLVVQHIVFNGNAKAGDNITIAGQGTTLINAINSVWEQLDCNFIGILTGHIHSDYSITESTHGYPIIATSCDEGGNARNDYDPVNPAEVGTVSEQLLDAVCIDTSARTIQCIRIGAGSNRSFTY